MYSNPYYSLNFVSPSPVYALVKEELNSYFASGAVDDVLFGLWTEKVLKKLGKGMYKITPVLLTVEDGRARLPEGFAGEREVWKCTEHSATLPVFGATYDTVISTASRLDAPDVKCDVCSECEYPQIIQAIYKTTHQVFAQYSRQHLLKKGNIFTASQCNLPCANDNALSGDIYDIHDNFIQVNFNEGVLFMLYYNEARDEDGFQLIPDDVRFQESVEYFLKYKLMEMLYNTASDESFNQCRIKKEEAKAAYEEKYVVAESWMKKENQQQKTLAIHRQKIRLNKYKFR